MEEGSVNPLSSEQIHHHERAGEEEDNPYVTNNDVNYVRINDAEVTHVENELEIEEELPENEDGCEQEPNLSISASDVRGLLGDKERVLIRLYN